MGGLPLPGLRRTAELVRSSRLECRVQLSPIVRVTGNDGFRTKSLLTKRVHAIDLDKNAQFVVVSQFVHW